MLDGFFRFHAPLIGQSVQNQPHGKERHRQTFQAGGQNGRGNFINVLVLHVFHDDRYADQHAEQCQQQAQQRKKDQRLVVAHDAENGQQHAQTVAYRVELGKTALGPIHIAHRHFPATETSLSGEQAEVRFDLESFHQQGIAAHKGPAHGPVAAHDVHEMRAADQIHQFLHQPVAEIMQGAGVLPLVIPAGTAIAHHHVGVARQHRLHQFPGLIRGIGAVGVGHQKDVRVHLHERPAHGVALALAGFMQHGAVDLQFPQGGLRQRSRAVCRVVVDHIDPRLRQGGMESGDGFPDGQGFIVGRENHGDIRRLPQRFRRSGGVFAHSVHLPS